VIIVPHFVSISLALEHSRYTKVAGGGEDSDSPAAISISGASPPQLGDEIRLQGNVLV
jgi:hypothetical protein